MRTMPLSTRLLAWILPVSVAIVLAASLSTYLIARSAILQEAQQGIAAVNDSAAAQVTGFFERRDSDLATVAQSPLFRDHYMNVEYGLRQEAEVYRREIESMLLDLSERARAYPELAYLDERGRELCLVRDGRRARPRPFDAPELFKAVASLKSGARLVSPIERVAWSAAPVVRYGTPLRDELGKLRGALIFTVSLQPVYQGLDRLKLGVTGRSFLSRRQSGRAYEDMPRGGQGLLVSASAVAGTPWSVVTAVSRDDFIERLAWVSTLTFFLVLIGATLLVFVLTRKVRLLLRPLQALAGAARSYAEGDWSARVQAEGPSEISALADSFNAMAQRLSTLLDAIRESETRYRTAIESSPDAVVSLDADFKVTLWNRRAAELFGYAPGEARGRALSSFLGERAFERLRERAQREGVIRHAEVSAKARDGRRLELALSLAGQPDGGQAPREWFVVIQDETEKKRLQAQLIQAEKLSAVGSLIAGVAHELNNPLAAVTGFAELLLKDLRLSAEDQEDLRILHQSAMRCHDIVQGLLLFARKSKASLQRLSLNFVVQQTLALVEYRLIKTEGISLQVELDPAGPRAAGEFQKLQQVLVNLIGNSVDALAGWVGEREIRVRTRALPDGSELEVEDSGPGVPPELRAAVFEPFYTTKPAGKGTGLGLSVSAQIAAELGGRLSLDQGKEGGARFILLLPPCSEALPEPESALMPPSMPGRRVLVVDDEPELARLMVRLLGEDGLEARAETDAGAAVARLEREPFDLVISDVDMGAAKGTAVLESARRQAKRPAFIFVTGDLLNRSLTAELSALEVPVLGKPFLRSEFLRLVRRALQARVSRPG